MDYNIGRLLGLLDELGISNDTLVVFTSDNGPENGAGSGGPRLKGMKRLLTEGGIRVPTIWQVSRGSPTFLSAHVGGQWDGEIPSGVVSNKFGVSTDIMPTLLHAAGISLPPHIRIDGTSLLPMLLNPNGVQRTGDERVVLWYARTVGYPNLPPPWRLFDMRERSPDSKLEDHNILVSKPYSKACKDKLGSGSSHPGNWSWEDVANIRTVSPDDLSAKEVSVLRQLVDYLQLRMHVFRFDGETSWRTGYYVRTCDPFPCLVSLRESTRVPFLKVPYSLPSGNRLLPPSIALFDWFPPQVNKPYQTYERGCHPRDYSVSGLMSSNGLISPPFCGSAVHAVDDATCLCPPSDCQDGWNRGGGSGWINGRLMPTAMKISQGGADLRTFANYLGQTLSGSKYNRLCGRPKDSKEVAWAVYQGLASLSGVRDISTTPKGDEKQRWRKARVLGRNCHPDSPVLVDSAGPFPPASLCASSLAYLQGTASKKRKVDSGALVFGIRFLLREAWEAHKPSGLRMAWLDPTLLPRSLLLEVEEWPEIPVPHYVISLAKRVFLPTKTINDERAPLQSLFFPLPIRTNNGVRGRGLDQWVLVAVGRLDRSQSVPPFVLVVYPPSFDTSLKITVRPTVMKVLSWLRGLVLSPPSLVTDNVQTYGLSVGNISDNCLCSSSQEAASVASISFPLPQVQCVFECTEYKSSMSTGLLSTTFADSGAYLLSASEALLRLQRDFKTVTARDWVEALSKRPLDSTQIDSFIGSFRKKVQRIILETEVARSLYLKLMSSNLPRL
eukprot:gene1427-1627_t